MRYITTHCFGAYLTTTLPLRAQKIKNDNNTKVRDGGASAGGLRGHHPLAPLVPRGPGPRRRRRGQLRRHARRVAAHHVPLRRRRRHRRQRAHLVSSPNETILLDHLTSPSDRAIWLGPPLSVNTKRAAG